KSGSATDVEMPELGESVTEGTITSWLKEVGDTVEVDEPLLEVSTDKVDTEIPSPVAGPLIAVLFDVDDPDGVGAVTPRIGDEDAAADESDTEVEAAEAQAEEKEPAKEDEADEQPANKEAKAEPKQEKKAEKKEEPKKDDKSDEGSSNADVPYVTPLVRKLADKHGVDLTKVEGSGIGGRIRKQDVLKAAEGGATEEKAPEAASAWSTKGVKPE